MRHRRPEERKDGIAEELRDETVIAGDGLAERLEERILKRAHLLGIETLGHRGEAGEVREENGDLPAIDVAVRRIRSRCRKGFDRLERRRRNADRRRSGSVGCRPGRVRSPGRPARGTEREIRVARKPARRTRSRLSAAAPRAIGEARCELETAADAGHQDDSSTCETMGIRCLLQLDPSMRTGPHHSVAPGCAARHLAAPRGERSGAPAVSPIRTRARRGANTLTVTRRGARPRATRRRGGFDPARAGFARSPAVSLAMPFKSAASATVGSGGIGVAGSCRNRATRV